MTVFSKIQKDLSSKPEKTLLLGPEVFASTWERRPKGPVAVGLRLLSEADTVTAIAEADKEARALHPAGGDDFIEARNGALLRWCVARGICDPNDVRQPSELFPMAEDQVREALSAGGARFIFEELERLMVERSPLHREATDEDLQELARILIGEEPLQGMTAASERMARRFVAFVLDEIRETAEAADHERH